MNGDRTLDLEAEYDNRGRVPEHPAIMAGWERDAAAYRAARAGRSELSISYGPHPRHTIDLFHADEEDAARPLIVFIHGGYWRSLEPFRFSHFASAANLLGYAVALPGYRLCPETTVAAIVEDIRSACSFLHRRLGRRLVVCGHSAGGHLAACMAATDWESVGADLPPELVRHGLAISGLFDLRPLLATSVNESLRLDEESAKSASPAFWPVPPGVRFEAWVGGAESSEYLRQSRLLVDSWHAAGARTRFEAVADANHFTAPAPLTDPRSRMVQSLLGLCQAAQES